MVFRTTNVTMNDLVRDVLMRTRRWLIDEGWCKGSMHDGGWCLAGAMTAVWDAEFGEMVMIRAERVLAHIAEKEMRDDTRSSGWVHPDITFFNDLPSTGFGDVIALIDRGIELVDARTIDPCTCDFAEVVVVVDWADRCNPGRSFVVHGRCAM